MSELMTNFAVVMLIIISTMAAGIVAGYFLRRRPLKYLDNIMMVVIWLLLFLLGLQAGGDERIVSWIASLGFEALVVSLAGVAGSSLFAMLLWRFVRSGRKSGGKEGAE